jgi:hypothetical protein
VLAGRMGSITPSMFAGHSMLCPYQCKPEAASVFWGDGGDFSAG